MDLKKLLVRTLSGAVFVAVLITSIIVSEWAFLALILVLSSLGIKEFHHITHAYHRIEVQRGTAITANCFLQLGAFAYAFAFDIFKWLELPQPRHVALFFVPYILVIIITFVAELFRPLGVHTEWTAQGVRLTKIPQTCRKSTWEVDFSQCPDLAQTFVVTAALLAVPFRFTGLASLRIKETDRIAALVAEMAKLGITLTPSADSISFQPAAAAPLPCLAPIRTYDDHRMAMAFAPAAYRFPTLSIADAGVVSKSYPSFWEDIQSLLC